MSQPARLRRPRWLAKLRALTGGYFWLPCKLCGRLHGGQEWRHGDDVPTAETNADGTGTWQGVCPICGDLLRLKYRRAA